LKGCDCR